MNKKSPKHKLHSLSLGLNSPTSPAKKKNEQFFIRKEKSKSNIQVIMDEIYQETAGKNSKIVKYLTQMNDFRAKSPRKSSLFPKFYRKMPKSMVNSLFSPKNETVISTKIPTKAIKTTTSINFSDNLPQKTKRLDLEIEDPDIINIYQSSLSEKPNKKLVFSQNSNFDEELRKKIKEMRMFVLQNTDILTKIKQKEHETAKSKLNVLQEKHKKHINIKEESIKKRFFKFWTKKNADKITEKSDSFVNLKENNSQKNLLTAESPKRKNTHNSRAHLTKIPYDIKKRLKDSIKENSRISVRKLTNIEKLMEKYTFTGNNNKRIDMDILNNLVNSKGFVNLHMNSSKSQKTLTKFFVTEEIKPEERTIFQKNQSPKQKFDLFYSDLMKYYKSEMIEKDSFEKNIDHQVKVYDDELKKINEQLFEFNADLDKDFHKEIDEGKLIKFSSIRRTKRKI